MHYTNSLFTYLHTYLLHAHNNEQRCSIKSTQGENATQTISVLLMTIHKCYYIPSPLSSGLSVSRPLSSSSAAHGRATAFCRCNTSLSFSTCNLTSELHQTVLCLAQAHGSAVSLMTSPSLTRAVTDKRHSLKLIFTALHVMQMRSSDENSVCLSVRPSVTSVNCDKTEERSVQIYIPYERSFSLVFWEEEWLMGATPSTWNFRTSPHCNKITDFEPIITRSASTVTPSEKKFN